MKLFRFVTDWPKQLPGWVRSVVDSPAPGPLATRGGRAGREGEPPRAPGGRFSPWRPPPPARPTVLPSRPPAAGSCGPWCGCCGFQHRPCPRPGVRHACLPGPHRRCRPGFLLEAARWGGWSRECLLRSELQPRFPCSENSIFVRFTFIHFQRSLKFWLYVQIFKGTVWLDAWMVPG